MMDTVLMTEWSFLLFFIVMWALATILHFGGRHWLGKDMMKYLTGDDCCSCSCTGHSHGNK